MSFAGEYLPILTNKCTLTLNIDNIYTANIESICMVTVTL